MCKISEYPGLYAKTQEVLRSERISKEIPGYELLRRAIVIYKVEGDMKKEKFLEEVEKGVVIPANKDLNLESKEGRNQTEQWMIEAIKSVGVDISLMEYIKQLANEIK